MNEESNTLACCQEDKIFLFCFPNEKDERDLKFSGISDLILGLSPQQ